MIEDIGAARRGGARLGPACVMTGISLRTYRRWTQGDVVPPDGRPTAVRLPPAHRLNEAERAEVACAMSDYKYRQALIEKPEITL